MLAIRAIVEALTDVDARFVVIGGVAMTLHGSSRATFDLDVVYDRSRENLERMSSALAPFAPRLRDFPPELPFVWDARTLRTGLNFTLTTSAGDLDLLGEVPGLGDYDAALASSTEITLFDRAVRVLDLGGLERCKRAAGRAKDLLDLETIAALKRR